jgi:hypothetical protein
MTQEQQIMEWLKINDEIIPAKMSGKIFKDRMFGSETSRACRALRKKGILQSEPRGKFEVFWIKGRKPVAEPNTCCPSYGIFGTHAVSCSNSKLKQQLQDAKTQAAYMANNNPLF